MIILAVSRKGHRDWKRGDVHREGKGKITVSLFWSVKISSH